jgi:hypothetical protein
MDLERASWLLEQALDAAQHRGYGTVQRHALHALNGLRRP